jgi:hypothetical protein
MGVVIETCAKYPGGPTRITVTDVLCCGCTRHYPHCTAQHREEIRARAVCCVVNTTAPAPCVLRFALWSSFARARGIFS